MRIRNESGYVVDITGTPGTDPLLPLGTEVTSTVTGREKGIIIGYNNATKEHLFYDSKRYPYVILWEDGYFEVYGIDSFKVKEPSR